jgi:uncharacterized alpha-E superfamily protein
MMLSRVAENIYWMSRYLERVENVARLILVNTNLQLDLDVAIRPDWESLITINGSNKDFNAVYDKSNERTVISFLVNEPKNPSSMLHAIDNARENIRTVRDYLPNETWEKINELRLFANNKAGRATEQRYRFDYLSEIVSRVQQITGMLAGTMIHDEGYQFLKMGRNLERADMTVRIIDVRSIDNASVDISEDPALIENIQWMTLLKSLSGYQAYRRSMQARVRRQDVLDFLFKERRFPRALYHTVAEVEGCLLRLRLPSELQVHMFDILEVIQNANPGRMSQHELHHFIDIVEQRLIAIDTMIANAYFLVGV